MAVYIHDRYAENDDAMLHISDLSIQRGYAVFDFFRVLDGLPLYMPDHLDRFYQSAAGMHLTECPERNELEAIIPELIKRSNIQQAGIRITLTGGYSPDSFEPAKPNLIITCNPIKMLSMADFEKGFSIITHEYQREFPQIKSIHYQRGVWLLPELKKQQADDVLYYYNNIISEFPRSNVFIVTSDNVLVTPKNNVLNGVTRKNILQIAADILPAEERDITLAEMMQAKEIFLAGTTKRIVPVIKVNNQIIGHGKPGSVTANLYEKIIDLEKFYINSLKNAAV